MAGMSKGPNYGANGGGGNTGKWIGAKGSFLESGIRVPAILSYPKSLPTNVVRDQAVTIMDWYPTLLDPCDVARPESVQFDGRSTVPYIENPQTASSHQQLFWQWKNGWAVRDGDWKLVSNGNFGLGQPKLPKLYLSNLSDEKPEAVNHSDAHPEVAERLNALHDIWAEDVFSVYKP